MKSREFKIKPIEFSAPDRNWLRGKNGLWYSIPWTAAALQQYCAAVGARHPAAQRKKVGKSAPS